MTKKGIHVCALKCCYALIYHENHVAWPIQAYLCLCVSEIFNFYVDLSKALHHQLWLVLSNMGGDFHCTPYNFQMGFLVYKIPQMCTSRHYLKKIELNLFGQHL